MIELDQRQILLRAQPASKQDAIRQVGDVLVANTYLGNGIAIPHGLPQDRDLIKRTGIAVMPVPDGVAWNDVETVRLVVGVPARSGEHIEVLRRLTRCVEGADTDRALQALHTVIVSGWKRPGP